MTQFKCLQSGNIASFENEWDIAQMKAHPGYVEIEAVKPAEKPVKKTAVKSEEE